MTHKDSIALYNKSWKMFIKMNKNGTVGCSPIVVDGAFPNGWESEIFKVIPIKENSYAFWSPIWKMFIKMNKNGTMGCSPIVPDGNLPQAWDSEIFTVVFAKKEANTIKVNDSQEKGAELKTKENEKKKKELVKLIKLEENKQKKLEEKKKKEQEKSLKLQEELRKHKLKSSRGEIYCMFCGVDKKQLYNHESCDGRVNEHNFIFMKDNKDNWKLKCNNCGKSKSYSRESCS